MKKLLILNGPNLNMLGNREKHVYGDFDFNKLLDELRQKAQKSDYELDYFQSNSESKIIDKLQISKDYQAIIINPAAFSHTSIAIRDTLLAIQVPFIEVHISNIFNREPFRQKTYTMDIASGLICGLGLDVYHLALQAAINLDKEEK